MFVALLALALALGFLGARGIWDPDEGRYTNVALTMLDSGDWVDPMRNEHTGHWTKPPVAYWLVASSVAAFGHTPWAARLPMALAYLACVFLTWRCARRLAPGTQTAAALIYATMLLPFGAGQLVTTDIPLAAAQALAVYAFVEYRFGEPATSGRWLLLMGVAFGLGFMTKGPPALIPLLAIVAFSAWVPRTAPTNWPLLAGSVLLFIVVALPWYVAVALRHEGLMQYFLGTELVDRVASDRFDRYGGWLGWAYVYIPTLLAGSLPWTVSLWHWARSLPATFRQWRAAPARQAAAVDIFLLLWIALPLLVFCLAQSRLPLYVLPLFVPLAVALALHRSRQGRALPRWPWLATWVVLLLALRLAAAHFPFRHDASAWAHAIRARATGPVTEVVFVEDMARYGLHLHLGAEIEKLSLNPIAQPRFNPEYDEPLIRELQEVEHETGLIFVAKQALWPTLQERITAYGYRARQLGEPYDGRVIFDVSPAAATQ